MKYFYIILIILLINSTYFFPTENLNKIFESENFIYFAQDDNNYKEISEELEKHFKLFSEKINYKNDDKIIVRIFKDINVLHNFLNLNDVPDWLIIYNKNGINLVSPYNAGPVHDYNSVLNFVGRSAVLSILEKLNNKIPNWLKSGICGFEVSYHKKEITDYIENYLINNNFPSLDDINNDFETDYKLVNFSYSFIEYIINKYDYIKLKKIIINPKDFKNIYGVELNDVYKEWKDSIINKKG